MKSFSSFNNHILLKSLIAIVIYPLLSPFFGDWFSQNQDSHDDNDNPIDLKNPSLPSQGSYLSGNPLVDQQYPLRLSSVNYFAFMLVMLLIDGFLKAIFQLFRKAKDIVGGNAYQYPEASVSTNWRQGVIQTVIISAVIYCFYQIMIEDLNTLFCSIIATTTVSSSVCVTKSGLIKESHRLLEEIEPINDEYEEPERMSLSMGRVLSSLNIQASHMVVTKDLKFAYATLSSSGGLKVIDISNLAAPNVVKTLSLLDPPIFFRERSMYLSPDEKTLFVSCFYTLEIIDVTNPESVYRLAFVHDDNFKGKTTLFDKFRLSISFALSADSKTLFVGCFGLQTFDISDLESPILLDSQLNDPKSGHFLLAIAATADQKTLWVANGTLDSYDISDARNMKLINSLSYAESRVTSIKLSYDNKTAFTLGMIGTEKIQITKLDLSNRASPVKTQSFVFAQSSDHPAFILSLSQKDRYMFIAVDDTRSINGGIVRQEGRIVVFDLIEKRAMINDQSLLATMKTVTTLSRDNSILASGSGKTMIIEFYKNFPNREIFSLANYPRQTREMKKKYNGIDFSQGEKHLFVVGYEDQSSKSLFEIYDFQKRISQDLVASFEIDFIAFKTKISADLRRAGILNEGKVLFLDMSSIRAPSYYSEYSIEVFEDIEDFAFWSESNIFFLITQTYQLARNLGKLKVIDLSDPHSPSVLFELTLTGGEDQSHKIAFSRNKTLFFLVGQVLSIYNSSNVHNLHRLGSINVTTEETEYVYFAQASHDGRRCFVETADRASFHKLKIYDTSDLQNPKLAAELILPMQKKEVYDLAPMLSEDSKTFFILQKQDVLAIDVSNIRAPRIFGLLPIGDVYQEGISQVKLSGDSRTMYLVTKNGTMHSISLWVPQTLFLNQEEFYIGQQYSDSPLVLRLDGGSEYTLIKDNEYKILRVGLFEVKVDATAETAKSSQVSLPGWASFDQTSKMLELEPRKQIDLGYHTLFAIMSNKVSAKAFSFLDPQNITARSTFLISELILRGYIDRQHFLTSEIGSLEDLSLPISFSNSEREQIYTILNQFYVVTCTTINILPSLRVGKEANQLFISSPNANFIKINIQLQNTTLAKFLRRSYGSLSPVISNNKSHLVIEGPLKEVNAALKNLTINLENLATCGAEMLVIDDMNPSVTVNLSDIKSYFRINTAPYQNPQKPIQKQISIVPVYTGQYFIITLDRNTILDENSETLNYKLISKAGQANDTIPSWLTFDDLTLRGTAPEELFDRDIEFTLIASNEFKKVEVPFKLHLKISSTFVAKLIMKYSPYILTILGLVIQANKIYNVLGKKYYKHKKNFFVEIGEEITNETIFPIAFIQQEKKESEIIWRYLVKRVSQAEMSNLLNESTGRERILKLIEETVNDSIPSDRKKGLKTYLRGVNYRKKIVNQLIINKLIYFQLKSKEEKATREAFEKFKDRWPELVSWDISDEYFKINLGKLDEILTETEVDVTRDPGESRLLQSNTIRVNLSLLIKALEAYTFDCHSIDKRAIRSKIKLKEKTEKNRIQSFLKLDIETINLNSQLQAAYGISWKFKRDSLVFTGAPCEDFKDKTLVVQILNSQHKIMKEIWIHEKNICEWSQESVRTEIEGKHYEVL